MLPTLTIGAFHIPSVCLSVTIASIAVADDYYPPALGEGRLVATDRSDAFLEPTGVLRRGVTIAASPPTIDFLYYPGQEADPGAQWSAWGDGFAVGSRYYSSIGDHRGHNGNSRVYEYDAARKQLRMIVDLRTLLKMPSGHYMPGKIHSRIDRGSDGWLYFSTYQGRTNATTDEYHYKGDWIVRHRPGKGGAMGLTEVVSHAPLAKHTFPASVLDPERLIFYALTEPGASIRVAGKEGKQFIAYDVAARRLLYADAAGHSRYLIFAESTTRVYYRSKDNKRLLRFDPVLGRSVEAGGYIGLRSATREHHGVVYTVSHGGTLYSFDTATEQIAELGPAAVAQASYIPTLDADPTGRYLYYMPNGPRSHEDGSPVVQYDLKTRRKKVIAFLFEFYADMYGYNAIDTFGLAVAPSGRTLYITLNGNRHAKGNRRFDTCALAVIHIPDSEVHADLDGLSP